MPSLVCITTSYLPRCDDDSLAILLHTHAVEVALVPGLLWLVWIPGSESGVEHGLVHDQGLLGSVFSTLEQSRPAAVGHAHQTPGVRADLQLGQGCDRVDWVRDPQHGPHGDQVDLQLVQPGGCHQRRRLAQHLEVAVLQVAQRQELAAEAAEDAAV